jgi:hypothetical protein
MPVASSSAVMRLSSSISFVIETDVLARVARLEGVQALQWLIRAKETRQFLLSCRCSVAAWAAAIRSIGVGFVIVISLHPVHRSAGLSGSALRDRLSCRVLFHRVACRDIAGRPASTEGHGRNRHDLVATLRHMCGIARSSRFPSPPSWSQNQKPPAEHLCSQPAAHPSTNSFVVDQPHAALACCLNRRDFPQGHLTSSVQSGRTSTISPGTMVIFPLWYR